VLKIVQHYVLVAANSGLRVGEQRQLPWKDVQLERHSANGSEQTLARIHVREETSKVSTSRTFLCRNGQYFERLRETVKPTAADELVFTLDGENQITQCTMLYNWRKMTDFSEIVDRETRELVPYSLRPFMITRRIMSGLTFRQIADMCGTSVAQIEKTYYHLSNEILLTNAVSYHRRNIDGAIEVL
jgi:site-specific recombinase XerD